MAQRYRSVKVDGRTKGEHRHVMEQVLQRPLERSELVHHRNGDGTDNRPENLEVLTAQQHSQHHNQRHPLRKLCVVCGQLFEPHPTKRARAQTCSRPCAIELMSLKRRARAIQQPPPATCPTCGVEFVAPTNHRATQETCSRSCAAKLRWQRRRG